VPHALTILYYDHTQLRVAAVLAVLLSAFTGFGIAICTNSLLVEYLRWRSRRNQRVAQRASNDRQRPQSESNHADENNGNRQQGHNPESGNDAV
jgi:type III secretory pathway component EscV